VRVLTELDCRVTLDDVWQNENGGRPPRPALQRLGEELFLEAKSLIKPAAIFDLFSVRTVGHNKIGLSNGESLRGPDIARLLAPAKQVFVAAVSIGSALEDRASRYFIDGERARGYLLDCLGTATMTNLVQQVCARFEPLAAPSGYPLGFPISPGDEGWPLTEQRVLFKMLPTDRIGLSLTDSCVMLPKKSVSFVVGLGPGIQTAAESSQCDYCSARESCRFKHSHAKSGCSNEAAVLT
jgi:hypothetical protein